MLSQLRDASKGWVAAIFVFLLVGAFAIWGVQDAFRVRISDTVAEVGKEEISVRAFLDAFDRAREQFGRSSNRVVQREEALKFGIDRIALNQLISQSLINQEGHRLGLTISDATLVKAIQDIDGFHGPDGKFNTETYKSVLRQNDLTVARFEKEVRGELLGDQLMGAVLEGIEPPTGFAQAFYDFGEERRRVSYLPVPASAAGKIGEPEDDALRTLYANNKERFTAPEFRSFTYMLLSPDDLASRVTVPDEDIVALYNFHKEKYVIPEKRAIRQILFDDEAAAKAAYQSLKAGADFIKVAGEHGYSAKDTDLGTVAKSGMVDAKFAEAAFALKKPGITEPVSGEFGWAVLKVEKIVPGSERTLDEVRPELKAERAKEMARDLVFELMREIEDARAAGQSLEEAAAAKDLTLHTAQNVDRRGRDASGAAPQGENAIPLAVLAQAFDANVGDENDFAETSGTSGVWFVTDVTDVTPSTLKPFDEVRDDVVKLWQQRQRREALVKYGGELADRVRAGEKLEKLAQAFGGRVVTPVDPIGRRAVDDHLTQELVKEIFRSPMGGTVAGLGQGDQTYVIAKVNDVVPAPGDQKLFAVANIQSSLEKALKQDVSEHFIVTLRERYGVTTNNQTIARALGREPTDER